MNARDRYQLGRLLDAIPADDTVTIVDAANYFFAKHPKIIQQLERKEWWGLIAKAEGRE